MNRIKVYVSEPLVKRFITDITLSSRDHLTVFIAHQRSRLMLTRDIDIIAILSVPLSRSGIPAKRLYISSHFLHHMIAPLPHGIIPVFASCEILTESTPTVAFNTLCS